MPKGPITNRVLKKDTDPTYKESQKRYYRNNIEKCKANMRRYYQANSERIRAKRKERYYEAKRARETAQQPKNVEV